MVQPCFKVEKGKIDLRKKKEWYAINGKNKRRRREKPPTGKPDTWTGCE